MPATVVQGISVGSWNTKPMPDGPAVQLRAIVPALGVDQAGDQAQQRGFAAAGRTDQRDKTTGRDGEIDRSERRCAGWKRLGDAAEGQRDGRVRGQRAAPLGRKSVVKARR